MSDERAIWRGHLKRGDAPGTVVGFLEDVWKWRVELTGTLDPAGGYKLEGRLGKVPDALRIAAIDDPPATKDG